MWTDLTTNWSAAISRLQIRFPNLSSETGPETFGDPSGLAEHLAREHDLTTLEAAEELRDWMFVENLARQAMELEGGDQCDGAKTF